MSLSSSATCHIFNQKREMFIGFLFSKIERHSTCVHLQVNANINISVRKKNADIIENLSFVVNEKMMGYKTKGEGMTTNVTNKLIIRFQPFGWISLSLSSSNIP